MYDNPGDLAAEILWLGYEYGGTPWKDKVEFSEDISEHEAEEFMSSWNKHIEHHKLT